LPGSDRGVAHRFDYPRQCSQTYMYGGKARPLDLQLRRLCCPPHKKRFCSKRAIRSPDNFAAEIEAAPGVHPARARGIAANIAKLLELLAQDALSKTPQACGNVFHIEINSRICPL